MDSLCSAGLRKSLKVKPLASHCVRQPSNHQEKCKASAVKIRQPIKEPFLLSSSPGIELPMQLNCSYKPLFHFISVFLQDFASRFKLRTINLNQNKQYLRCSKRVEQSRDSVEMCKHQQKPTCGGKNADALQCLKNNGVNRVRWMFLLSRASSFQKCRM